MQQDGFSSTSLVHSPCLSLVGLWHGVVDVLNTVGLPVDELQFPQLILPASYTDMMCLTKAGKRKICLRELGLRTWNSEGSQDLPS